MDLTDLQKTALAAWRDAAQAAATDLEVDREGPLDVVISAVPLGLDKDEALRRLGPPLRDDGTALVFVIRPNPLITWEQSWLAVYYDGDGKVVSVERTSSEAYARARA